MLTRIEQETIITYNEQESTAEVDTCNKALINQLDGLCAKTSCITCVAEDEHGKRYILPKKWVKVKMPKQYSEEQRLKMAERARELFHSKAT